jgi:hypothetical protein
MSALLSSLVSTTRPWLCGSEQGEPSARARKNICTKDVRKDRNEKKWLRVPVPPRTFGRLY